MERIGRGKRKPSSPTDFFRDWGFSPASSGATNACRINDGDLEDYAGSGPNGVAFATNEQPF